MNIDEQRLDRAIVVAPKGRIDSTSSPALEQHFAGLLTGGHRQIVVDFTGVDYISSAGLRVLLGLAKRIKESKGGLALCGMGEAVQQVFALAGFLPLFAIADSRDAAVNHVRWP